MGTKRPLKKTAADLYPQACKGYKFIGRLAKEELADLYETEAEVIEGYHLKRLQQGHRLPLIVIEGGMLGKA